MSYRKTKEYKKWGGERRLVDIIVDVHSTTMGSFERCDERQKEDIEILKAALENWDHNNISSHKEFDETIKKLAQIAIKENKCYRNKRKNKSFKMCKNGNHLLKEIFRANCYDAVNSEYVVRWCSKCGAVVVDIDCDGRTNPGAFMKMKFPMITKTNRDGV